MDFELNLKTETVQHIYSAEPVSVAPETPIGDVFQTLKEANTGCALVCENDVLKGVFTERDALKLMAAGSDLDAPIASVMSSSPVTIGPNDSVAEAIKKMAKGGYRRLPIVDEEGRPQGILKVSGLLHYVVEHVPKVVYNLPPQPHPTVREREGA